MTNSNHQSTNSNHYFYYKIAGFLLSFGVVFYILIFFVTISPEVANSRKMIIQKAIQDESKNSNNFINQETIKIFAPLKARIEDITEKLKKDRKAVLFIEKKELLELLNKDEIFSAWQEYSYIRLSEVIEIHIFYPTKNIALLEYLPFIKNRFFQWKYGVVITVQKEDVKLNLKRFSMHSDGLMQITPDISKSIKTDIDIWQKIKSVKMSPIGLIIEFAE